MGVRHRARDVVDHMIAGRLQAMVRIRPGEEMGQGVGYLEDGTMIVAENSSDNVNEEVAITVTSVSAATKRRSGARQGPGSRRPSAAGNRRCLRAD